MDSMRKRSFDSSTGGSRWSLKTQHIYLWEFGNKMHSRVHFVMRIPSSPANVTCSTWQELTRLKSCHLRSCAWQWVKVRAISTWLGCHIRQWLANAVAHVIRQDFPTRARYRNAYTHKDRWTTKFSNSIWRYLDVWPRLKTTVGTD